jgi:hypothetical protein
MRKITVTILLLTLLMVGCARSGGCPYKSSSCQASEMSEGKSCGCSKCKKSCAAKKSCAVSDEKKGECPFAKDAK